jgi:hypothetical protein
LTERRGVSGWKCLNRIWRSGTCSPMGGRKRTGRMTPAGNVGLWTTPRVYFWIEWGEVGNGNVSVNQSAIRKNHGRNPDPGIDPYP